MNATLEVPRSEMIEALRLLERTTRSGKRGKLRLLFQDGELVLEVAGASSAVPAAGRWEGAAQIEGDGFLGLHRAFPAGDPVRLSVEGGQLKMGGWAIGCSWISTPTERIPTTLNATQLDLLAVPLHYSRDQIEHSGILGLVQSSEEWRDDLIRKASAILEPLGIGEADLHELVEKRLRRRPPLRIESRAVQGDLGLPRSGELDLT